MGTEALAFTLDDIGFLEPTTFAQLLLFPLFLQNEKYLASQRVIQEVIPGLYLSPRTWVGIGAMLASNTHPVLQTPGTAKYQVL